MSRLYNLARMHAATLGTGSLIDLGNAVTGFLTFASAGVTDGITVSYAINDPLGGGSEVGSGVYHSSGPSFTRTTVEKSSSGTSRISLSASAEIMIAPSAADLNLVYDYAQYLSLTSTALSPATTDTVALGTSAAMWSDAFFASGAVLNFNNGDVTVTHSANALAFAGASSGYSFDAVVKPSADDAAALGSATVSWADLFLASGGVINWNNGDVTLTHSANALAFAGASSGYTFDAPLIGGSATSSTITIQSTAGAGATDRIIFKTGSQVESASIETMPGSNTLTLASGSLPGLTAIRAGTTQAGTGIFTTPGIGPAPSSGLLFVNGDYADSSAGNISNIFAVACNSGSKYTAGGTFIGVARTGAVGANIWGGQCSAIFQGSGAGIGQGINIECDYSTGTGTYIGATIKLGDSAGGVTVNAGNCYINCLADTGKTPVTGLRFQSTAFNSTNTQSVLNVEGGSAVNGIDLSSMTFTGSPFKSTAFSVGSTGIVTGLSSVFTADRAIRCNNQTSSAAAQVGTLTNAPAAGNPGFWLKINVGGTNYAVPCWAG